MKGTTTHPVFVNHHTNLKFVRANSPQHKFTLLP